MKKPIKQGKMHQVQIVNEQNCILFSRLGIKYF